MLVTSYNLDLLLTNVIQASERYSFWRSSETSKKYVTQCYEKENISKATKKFGYLEYMHRLSYLVSSWRNNYLKLTVIITSSDAMIRLL